MLQNMTFEQLERLTEFNEFKDIKMNEIFVAEYIQKKFDVLFCHKKKCSRGIISFNL